MRGARARRYVSLMKKGAEAGATLRDGAGDLWRKGAALTWRVPAGAAAAGARGPARVHAACGQSAGAQQGAPACLQGACCRRGSSHKAPSAHRRVRACTDRLTSCAARRAAAGRARRAGVLEPCHRLRPAVLLHVRGRQGQRPVREDLRPGCATLPCPYPCTCQTQAGRPPPTLGPLPHRRPAAARPPATPVPRSMARTCMPAPPRPACGYRVGYPIPAVTRARSQAASMSSWRTMSWTGAC